MSFASETKNELARIVPEKKCCMLAEIAAFIRFSGSVGLSGGGRFRIVMTTEYNAIARHYRILIKQYFSVDAEIEVEYSGTLGRRRFILVIEPEQSAEQILRETGMLMVREGFNYITDGIYGGLIRTKCCRKAYLRGAFLAAGTMTNPEKAYHFEIKAGTETLAHDPRRLFNAFADIHALVSHRKQGYFVYLKRAERILDILAIMGAHTQYFAYEETRLTKELRNEANRRSNCDQANIDKSLAASERQIRQIRSIAETRGLSSLPEKLRQVAQVRLAHPEVSLAELGSMLTPPLKKSGVNSRLRRLAEIAEEIPSAGKDRSARS